MGPLAMTCFRPYRASVDHKKKKRKKAGRLLLSSFSSARGGGEKEKKENIRVAPRLSAEDAIFIPAKRGKGKESRRVVKAYFSQILLEKKRGEPARTGLGGGKASAHPRSVL